MVINIMNTGNEYRKLVTRYEKVQSLLVMGVVELGDKLAHGECGLRDLVHGFIYRVKGQFHQFLVKFQIVI